MFLHRNLSARPPSVLSTTLDNGRNQRAAAGTSKGGDRQAAGRRQSARCSRGDPAAAVCADARSLAAAGSSATAAAGDGSSGSSEEGAPNSIALCTTAAEQSLVQQLPGVDELIADELKARLDWGHAVLAQNRIHVGKYNGAEGIDLTRQQFEQVLDKPIEEAATSLSISLNTDRTINPQQFRKHYKKLFPETDGKWLTDLRTHTRRQKQ